MYASLSSTSTPAPPASNPCILLFFFFNDTATTEIYTLSLHDALPISAREGIGGGPPRRRPHRWGRGSRRHAPRLARSEEHTSELQSRLHLVCRLLLEKKKKAYTPRITRYSSVLTSASTSWTSMSTTSK